MRKMKPQFWAGFGVAVLALIGIWAYAYWGVEDSDNESNSVAAATVEEFTETMRDKVIAEMGQPIEGFEPFMFMRVYPGLQARDFDYVSAEIGLYRYQNGELVYDKGGETELHTAARAISNIGMADLLENLSERLGADLEGSGTLADIFASIEASPGDDPTDESPAVVPGNPVVVTGMITCLPHKGSGPHTLECAVGLKGDDNRHYALLNMQYPDMADTGDRVRITGTLDDPNEFQSSYDIVGVLTIQALVKI